MTLVPYTNANLLSSASDASASPLVIAAKLAGIRTLPSLINAVLLTVVLSAANSNVYSGSRILVGLAQESLAPKILTRTTTSGVPYIAVTITAAFGLLAFMNLDANGTAVFNWFINISGVAGFIAWTCINISHLFFMRALSAQNISRDSLPYKAPWQPWFSYYGAGFNILIILTQGFTCFIGEWSTSAFFVAYVSVIMFVVLFVGHKVVTRSRGVNSKDVDLVTGRLDMDDGVEEEEKDGKENPRASLWGRVSGWIFG